MKLYFSNLLARLELVTFFKLLVERRRIMESLSIIYLIIPYVIFCATWLKPWAALASVLVIVFAFRSTILTYSGDVPKIEQPKKRRKITFLAIGATLLLWAFFSGAGGFAPQTGDYLKHNAIYHDLITHQWPITYENGNGLAYYIGYYLPASAIGKLTSPQVADYFQLFWMTAGIFLVFYWLCRMTGKVRLWLALLLIGFSGMDIIAYVFFHQGFPSLGFLALEWATSPDIGIWQYSSNTTSLYWTPQHAIAGWLITAMIVSEFLEKKAKKNTLFLYSLMWLASPLIALWLIPFISGLLVIDRRSWRSFVSFQNIIFPATMAIIIGLYYMTNIYKQPFGFIWEFIDFKGSLFLLVPFLLLEYGIYALLLRPYVKKEKKELRVLFYISIIMFTIMPLFMYGLYNDQLMRGSIPALFILMVIMARMFLAKGYKLRKVALIGCLIIGSIVPFYELYNHLDIGKPKQNDWVSIENNKTDLGTRNLQNQYYGNKDSLFYKLIAQ